MKYAMLLSSLHNLDSGVGVGQLGLYRWWEGDKYGHPGWRGAAPADRGPRMSASRDLYLGAIRLTNLARIEEVNKLSKDGALHPTDV